MDHPLPWLRYVDADNITVPDLALDGMKVRNDAMEKLGNVEGFIVDNASMRPYYVVVDSGGWFKSKEFLLPIGHARLDADRDALVVDIPKSRIEQFPGFDRNTFERLSEDEVRRMNDAICGTSTDTIVVSSSGQRVSSMWDRPDYSQPDWWASDAAISGGGIMPAATSAGSVARATGELQAEQELARERARQKENVSRREHTKEHDRELVTAKETDVSPYFDGRAQPGDVIGVETGGEQTHIGETSEDENKRRVDAMRDAEKHRDRD